MKTRFDGKSLYVNESQHRDPLLIYFLPIEVSCEAPSSHSLLLAALNPHDDWKHA